MKLSSLNLLLELNRLEKKKCALNLQRGQMSLEALCQEIQSLVNATQEEKAIARTLISRYGEFQKFHALQHDRYVSLERQENQVRETVEGFRKTLRNLFQTQKMYERQWQKIQDSMAAQRQKKEQEELDDFRPGGGETFFE